MASSSTGQVLDNISQCHLECTICFEPFKNPKVLDCLHSFCKQCLEQLKQTTNQMACPVCRQVIIVKDNLVANLNDNFTLSALVEEFKIQAQLLEQKEVDILCQSCDNRSVAIARCMDCNKFICEKCKQSHELFTVTKSHQIFTLAQFQSGDVIYKSNFREYIPKCNKHPEQHLNVSCNSCEQSVCTTCALVEHGDHTITAIREAAERYKQHIDEHLQLIKPVMSAFDNAIKRTVEYRTKLNNLHSDACKKIATQVAIEFAKIRENANKVQQELDGIYQDSAKIYDAALSANNKEFTGVNRKLEEVNQFVGQASCYEILDMKAKLDQSLRELQKKHPVKETEVLEVKSIDIDAQSSPWRVTVQPS